MCFHPDPQTNRLLLFSSACTYLSDSKSKPVCKASFPPLSFNSSSFAIDHHRFNHLLGPAGPSTNRQLRQCSSSTHIVRGYLRRECHVTDSRLQFSSLPYCLVLPHRMGTEPHWCCSPRHCSWPSAIKTPSPIFGFQHSDNRILPSLLLSLPNLPSCVRSLTV